MLGRASDCCRDQVCSRFIQKSLGKSGKGDKDAFYKEISIDELQIANAKVFTKISLLRDVFGNYVVQKMLDFGSPSQLNDLLEFIVI